MKETGIIRRMDDLGRIVIPKEIRRLLNLREGDALELFLHEQGVFYKKYDPAKPVKACLATLKEAVMDEPALECSEEVMQKISELEDLLAREYKAGEGGDGKRLKESTAVGKCHGINLKKE